MEKASRLAVSIDEQRTPSHVVARVIRCLAADQATYHMASRAAEPTIERRCTA